MERISDERLAMFIKDGASLRALAADMAHHLANELLAALRAEREAYNELREAAEQVYTAFTVWEDTDMFAVQARATQHLRSDLDKQEGR